MVEIFDKQRFESVLPCHKTTKQPLWESKGLANGEFVYNIKTNNPHVWIHVRSSVKSSGISAETGKDSIRCWLVGKDGMPLGSKLQKYTTRVSGWDERLLAQLRQLYLLASKIVWCDKCNDLERLFKVKANTENKGRFFKKCQCVNSFTWVTDKAGELI